MKLLQARAIKRPAAVATTSLQAPGDSQAGSLTSLRSLTALASPLPSGNFFAFRQAATNVLTAAADPMPSVEAQKGWSQPLPARKLLAQRAGPGLPSAFPLRKGRDRGSNAC
jgi:hypothetical protein